MKKSVLVCVALLATTGGASAATLDFVGTAVSTCALTLPINGTLTLGADLQSWATATQASITAVNTSAATLSLTAPTTWSVSPASTPATTFAITGNMTGSNSGALTGTSTARSGSLSAIGATIVTVSLAATATAPYRSGLHTAQVTVTCSVP